MIPTIDECRDMLKNNICYVTFTKVDGSERIMRCTLISDYLPTSPNWASYEKTLSETNKSLRYIPNPNMISVWDLEKGNWRGFMYNQIKEIKIGV